MGKELTTNASLNASGFNTGVEAIKSKLKTLNTALVENKQALKDTNKEAEKLRKQQKELAATMKDGGTEEQRAEMERLSTALAQVNAKIGSLRATEKELQIGINSTTNELKEATGATDKFSKTLANLKTVFLTVIASTAGKNLYNALIGSNADIEQFEAAFKILLGGAEQAKEFTEELTQFAAKTPLNLTDVINSSQFLMNYGVDDEDVIDKMTKLGNLASGNADKLNRVSTAYGQMLAKGKVTGEELRQMTEAGVPLLQALADTMGMSTADVQKMISAGKVGIAELDAAINSLTTGNGKFAGMMEEQAKTYTGMISTAKDTLAQFGRDVGDESFNIIKNKLSEIMDKVENWQADGTLEDTAEDIGAALGGVVNGFIFLSEAAIDNKEAILALAAAFAVYKVAISIAPLIDTATKAIKGLSAAAKANQFAIIAAVIASAVVGIKLFVDKMNEASERAKEFNNAISDINKTANNTVTAAELEVNALNKKIERYNELREKITRTSEESLELRDLANELQGVFGDNVVVINKLTGEYSDLSDAAAAYGEQQLGLAKIDAAKEKLTELYKLYEQTENEKSAVIDEIYSSPAFQTGFIPVDEMLQNVWLSDINSKEISIKSEYDDRLKDISARITETENEIKTATTDYYKTISDSTYDFGDNLNGDGGTASQENAAAVTEADNSISQLSKSAKELSTAFAEQNESGSLSAETISSLIESGNSAILMLDRETGAVKLNAKAYRELTQAKINAQVEALETARDKATKGHDKKIEEAWRSGNTAEALELQSQRNTITAKYDIQIAALNAFPLDKVINGAYGISSTSGTTTKKKNDDEKEEPKETPKTIKPATFKSQMESISAAFKEQADNGQITIETAEKLIDAEYAEGVAIDETTGKITLKKDELNDMLVAAADYQISILEAEKKEKEALGESTAAISSKIAIYNRLKKEISEVSAGSYGVVAEKKDENAEENSIDYEDINKSFKNSVEDRIAAIKEELEVKKKASEEAIEAIDAEIEARKRLNEDEDIQSEIDYINAQLNYAQLDEFSRYQLEKKRQSLYDEQAELAWARGIDDRKAAINAEYEKAENEGDQEIKKLEKTVDIVNGALGSLSDGIEIATDKISAALSALNSVFRVGNVVNNSTNNSYSSYYESINNNAVTFNNAQNFTMGQIVSAVIDALQSAPII